MCLRCHYLCLFNNRCLNFHQAPQLRPFWGKARDLNGRDDHSKIRTQRVNQFKWNAGQAAEQSLPVAKLWKDGFWNDSKTRTWSIRLADHPKIGTPRVHQSTGLPWPLFRRTCAVDGSNKKNNNNNNSSSNSNNKNSKYRKDCNHCERGGPCSGGPALLLVLLLLLLLLLLPLSCILLLLLWLLLSLLLLGGPAAPDARPDRRPAQLPTQPAYMYIYIYIYIIERER